MTNLTGRRILIIEDEFLIADNLAQDLREQGAAIVGPVGTVAGAVDLLAGEARIDGAVLDINLDGQESYTIAGLLLERSVPFVFATGYDGWTIQERYRGVPRCEKPVSAADIARALFGA